MRSTTKLCRVPRLISFKRFVSYMCECASPTEPFDKLYAQHNHHCNQPIQIKLRAICQRETRTHAHRQLPQSYYVTFQSALNSSRCVETAATGIYVAK